MERTQDKSPTTANVAHHTARRSSSALLREPLPTPPPDPRDSTFENIFKYPPSIKTELPAAYRCLLECSKRDEEFFKMLNEAIESDCQQLQAQQKAAKTQDEAATKAKTKSAAANVPRDFTAEQIHECPCCEELREECEQYMQPLQMRFKSSASAALAAYGAIDQLNRLYSMWDQYLDVEKRWRQRKECLKYVNQLEQKIRPTADIKKEKPHLSDTEAELEQSVALLESILNTTDTASAKRNLFKQPRERSKSVIVEDVSALQKAVDLKTTSPGPYMLRRQSTYSDGKSKVSKWTKVKAAFKWERANVPAMSECSKDLHNGLQPINHEVARYLRVPSVPAGGGSSADSILSSSSGHLLSEAGTPGTISSASSMDDIIDSCNSRNALRRDSSKSDTRCDSRITDIMELSSTAANDSHKTDQHDDAEIFNQKTTTATTAKPIAQSKSSSNKSLRRGKTVTDFEVVPEDVVADIKSVTTRKTRLPPTPLNLNLKQDLNENDGYYLPYLSKSPKDGTQSLNRTKKLHSPGNSSVPSSPSRHSDFFAEFESEELSSGDLSEPSSPNHLSSRKTFHQKQDEINQRYKMLRAKLDVEFTAKRREWEKIKNNPNSARALSLITPPRSEELSPNQQSNATPNVTTKLLEENLTPDFKKKLNKWRVKKQISHSGSGLAIHQQQQQHQPPQSPQPTGAGPAPVSPNKDVVCYDPKGKIDWNLWRTGQLKFEGQGVCALPDRKDLPEEFQKKLEQWNKIKRCGGGGSVSGASTGNDSIKRHSKGGSKNKGSDDDRCYWGEKEKRDKHKAHEKDKSEKFAKLKAIVAEHPAKEIEVKTSAGVMKFEGISRKFTRKLYEWEKSRGIGPESSTFALLHPGYCPIDVGRIKEGNNNENSPTLSRSLSLESVSPNICLPVMTHQASSLSLNDLNELKDVADSCCTDNLAEVDFKRYDEPEAVMVEVEDHIVETAKPLVTANSFVEQQTPVYKYEEMACNDYCNTRRIQSFESPTNVAPLLSMLKRSDELFADLKAASADIGATKAMQLCEASVLLIRNVYSYFTQNLVKPNVLNAISDVQIELSRLVDLLKKSPLNEPCCTEVMEERYNAYDEELRGLYDALEFLRHSIQGGQNRYPKEFVPDINITTEDGLNSSLLTTCDNVSKDQLSTATLEATDELSASLVENDTESTTSTTLRSNLANNNQNNNSTANTNNVTAAIVSPSMSNANNGISGTLPGKKKLRLRKMGSRQSSKTESDSSDQDVQNVLIETPRRIKRKNFRLKQRSLDDDFRRNEEYSAAPAPAASSFSTIAENVVYVLKVKPGLPIEQSEKVSEPAERTRFMSVQPMPEGGEIMRTASNPNVFVKTKRKLFTAIQEPNAVDGVALIVKDIDTTTSSDEVKKLEHKSESPTNNKRQAGDTNTSIATTAAKRAPLLNKALSMSNIERHSFEDERKCHSAESIKNLEAKKEVRSALASDSFRVINKTMGKASATGHPAADTAIRRREHIFKKNPEKLNKSVSATIKKIETKIAKTNSGSSVEQATAQKPPLAHDRTGNTLPRICRKLERKSLTPTTKDSKFDYTLVQIPQPTQSEPTTPMHEQQQDKPHTPLSERAQRLAKAKEQFLQGRRVSDAKAAAVKATTTSAGEGIDDVKLRDEIVRNETWEQYRRSDQSTLSSIIGEDGQLLKSMSVDTITANTTTASEAGTDVESDFRRSVARSGKFSSKLGFATLASKFRRGKKTKDNGGGTNNSALSALCKQSLLVDVIAAPQVLSTGSGTLIPSTTSTTTASNSSGTTTKTKDHLMKSLSTPHAASSSAAALTQATRRQAAESLNKSQSEQIVKRQKESFV